MKLDTVAEYVETDKARKLVTDLGVNFAQGHAIGIPQPLEDVLATLKKLETSTG
jgi:EAL domain-containing protein (putative c-di-GMP-specific phosphodiesterase class I)